MATIKWDGGTSTDAEVASNWQGGVKPGSGDDVVFDNTSSGGCQLTADVSWASMTMNTNWDQNLDINGYTITSAGNVSIDGSAGTLTWNTPSKIIITGDADFTATESGMSLSGTPDIELQGTGELDINDPSINLNKLTCAASGKTTTVNGTNLGRSNTLTVGAGTLHILQRWAVWLDNGTESGFTTQAGHSITGSQSLQIRNNSSTAAIQMPAMDIGDGVTVNMFCNDSNAKGYTFTGAVTGSGILEMQNNNGDTSSNVYDLNGQDITAKRIDYGSNSSGDRMNINFGGGTIDLSEGIIALYDSGDAYLDFESATIYTGGSIDLGASTTVDSVGTASIEFDGATAATIMSDGEQLPDIVINKSSNGVTLQDAASFGDFEHSSGNFDMNGNTMSCIDFTVSSAGTKTYDAAVTSTGSIDVDVTMTVNRLIRSSSTTMTVSAGTTFTLSNYTSGDWNGTTTQSDSGGSDFTFANPSGMTMLSSSWKDTDASNTIDATDGSNTDLGGNTNINFGAASAVGAAWYHHAQMMGAY